MTSSKKPSFVQTIQKLPRSMKSQHLSLPISQTELQETEDFLLGIAKYPVLFAQMNGYLPLCVKKSPSGHSSLAFSFLSIPCVICCLQLLLIISPFSVESVLRFKYVYSQGMASAESDSLMLKFTMLLTFLNSLLNKIAGFVVIRSSLSFWKTNCQLLRLQWSRNKISSQTSQRIQRLQSYLKTAFFGTFLIFVPAAVILAVFDITTASSEVEKQNHGLEAIPIGMEKRGNPLGFFGRAELLSWTFFNVTHSLSFLWVTIFVKIYCISLQGIAEDVNALSFQPEKNIGQSNSLICIDDVVNRSILMSENIYILVKHFHSLFAFKFLTETVVSLIVLLGLANFCVIWTADGEYSAATTFMLPLIISCLFLYHISSVGTDLKGCGRQVVEAFHSLPYGNMTPETQWKVQMFISKLTNYPLEISPGSFFTLNKETVTSIISFLVTSILVLAQFRGTPDSEKATAC